MNWMKKCTFIIFGGNQINLIYHNERKQPFFPPRKWTWKFCRYTTPGIRIVIVIENDYTTVSLYWLDKSELVQNTTGFDFNIPEKYYWKGACKFWFANLLLPPPKKKRGNVKHWAVFVRFFLRYWFFYA